MNNLELVMREHRAGMFIALLDGREVVRSRTPFFDAARKLLAEGVAPETVLTARHERSATEALRCAVGEAALWTVSESDGGGLRKQRWLPFSGLRGGDAHHAGVTDPTHEETTIGEEAA